MSIKQSIKRIIPEPIFRPLQNIYSNFVNHKRLKEENRLIKQQPDLHRKAVAKIREAHRPINVVFFALMDSVWKYDELYKLMEKDSRFNPTILVCPVVNYGRENMLLNMDKSYNLFKGRGYNVIRTYDIETNKYVDVRKELKPDVIFYTNPYEGLIDDRYYITNYTDLLTCYAPYGISESKSYQNVYNLIFHNIVWKYYLGYSYAVETAKKYARNKGVNVIHSGFPGVDWLIKGQLLGQDPWKIKDRKIKRIIWAPHHTITDYSFVSYSTFLYYYDYFFELADRYKGKIQIAFKPHPLLKNRLELLWGKDKTLNYYNRWKYLPNGMLDDGAYEDLFISSDAIIHDSGSFICEYLYTKNPSLFLSNGKNYKVQYNDFTLKCLDNYYIGNNKKDIEKFINDLLKGRDFLKEKRENFYSSELLPPNNKLSSENIMNDLIKELVKH